MTDWHKLHYAVGFNKLADIQERWTKRLAEPANVEATVFPHSFIKRDVNLRCKLKMGTMLDQRQRLCESESTRSRPFANTISPDVCLIRRATTMHRDGLLLEKTVSRNSIAFLVGESEVMDASYIARVESHFSPRIYDEDRRRSVEHVPVSAQLSNLTSMMERYGMPK
ncbi:hypothetical protein PHMEG_00014447 [Phytophthora megakarya]|uniref:Uncharacterized protein n=1 Tax=Phytophthora megakarya TaxID=4795 RepID=A0A225W4B2_9STRA|nr:hypothetical protein PHMEG_00014447 [Phytophthora megakarya]